MVLKDHVRKTRIFLTFELAVGGWGWEKAHRYVKAGASEVQLIVAPFGCSKFKQEHYLDHFLNPAHSSY